MDKDIKIIVTVVIGVIALLGAYVVLFGADNQRMNFSGAGAAVVPLRSSTTAIAFTAGQVRTLISTTTGCVSRTISTDDRSSLMIIPSAANGETPTDALGFLHATATAVIYENIIMGCGHFQAYSFNAQTVTVTETN